MTASSALLTAASPEMSFVDAGILQGKTKIMNKIKILLLTLALFCFGLTGQAAHAAQAPAALVNKIQEAYKQIESFEAEFDQTLTHKESGSTEKRKGKLQFQKPLLIRWQTRKPHEELLIVNSKEIWNYLPDEEIAYRYAPHLVQDSRSIIQVLTGQAKLSKDFDVKPSGKAGANGLQKLTLFPKDPTPQMVEAAIWVDPATGAIQRASVTDFYGNVNDVAFNSFKPGAKIAAGQFAFKPPKGIEVEDRIKQDVQERELFK